MFCAQFRIPQQAIRDADVIRFTWSREVVNAHEFGANGVSVQKILGVATSDEKNVPGVPGARMNTFQGGAIYWSPSTGAHVVYGAIGAKYNAMGGPTQFGLPLSDEAHASGLLGNVRVQRFKDGIEITSSVRRKKIHQPAQVAA